VERCKILKAKNKGIIERIIWKRLERTCNKKIRKIVIKRKRIKINTNIFVEKKNKIF
jgi:hypothetical protein